MGRRGGSDNEGKYLRLTGLWPSKKNNSLWTGKFRNQDIGRLQDKIQEADDAGADLVVFLWENNEKKGNKDPEFTVQISVAEDNGGGRQSNRGRSSGSSRRSSRDNDRDSEQDNDQNSDDDSNEENKDEEPEEREEKPSRRSPKSDKPEPKRGKKEEEPRRRSGGSSNTKKDDNW